MVDLTSLFDADRTLKACDDAFVAKMNAEPPRPYLGASSIGENCSRKLWLRFRFVREKFDAETLKKFRDGHITEKTIVSQLKLLPSLTLEGTGEHQIEIADVDLHFRGHLDGTVMGLLEAPKTKHVLEIKAVADKKFNEIKKYKLELGEKLALRKFSPTYYAQIVLYMYKMGLTRAFHVFASAGGRAWVSIRTEEDVSFAKSLIEKARRIIYANDAPTGVSQDSIDCKYCSFAGICWKKELPPRQCRICVHASPVANGKWECQLYGEIDYEKQLVGCPSHTYLPSFINGEVVSATETSITYKMKSGEIWTDGVQK